MRIIALSLCALTLLSACKDDTGREVISLTSPSGLPFLFMEIDEPDVTDITISVAWPTMWPVTQGKNPAVPYVGAQYIPSVGTPEIDVATMAENFADMNASGAIEPNVAYVKADISFPREHTDTVVPIANEMLQNSPTQEQWLTRIKQGIFDGQRQNLDLSSTKIWMAQRLALYGDTPLVASLDLPDLTMIDKVTLADVAAWQTETFTRAGVKIGVAGAISAKDAGEAVDALFEGLPEGTVTVIEIPLADMSPITILLHDPSAEKTTLAITGPMPVSLGDDAYDDLLAFAVFGAQPGGPLFDAVRTKLRATYGLEASSFESLTNRPFMYITGEIDTEKLAEARDTILASYNDFRINPDLSGLDDARGIWGDLIQENISYVDVSAFALRETLINGDDYTAIVRSEDIVRARTQEQVKARIMSAFPPADQLSVFAISPDENALPGACVITNYRDAVTCK